MKVSEIIKEATAAPTAAAPATGRAASLAGGTPTTGYRSVIGSAAKFKKVYRAIDYRRQRTNTRVTSFSDKMQSKLGMYATILKWAGIFEYSVELWNDLGEAEAAYMAGEIDQESFKQWRQGVEGLFMGRVATPALVRTLAQSRWVIWIAKLIVRVLTLGSTIASGGVGIVAMVASEAFFTWLTYWLSTKEAIDWMRDWIVQPCIFAGAISDKAWDLMFDYYKNKDAQRVAQGKPTGVAANQQPAAMDQPGVNQLGIVAPKTAPVMINGVRVTDSDGYLSPYAMSDLAVKAALADPKTAAATQAQLAALPTKPQ